MTKETISVTLEDVRRVAELANLELAAEEEPRMQHDLNAILGYIAELSELNTDDVPPMAQVAEILGDQLKASAEALRADELRPCLDRKIVMEEAPETDGVFFKVPKVIERA
jgi:aspartyl-tRNA(Asn)/glutamyl-tRNA(Gln) amidotransferase subunit C